MSRAIHYFFLSCVSTMVFLSFSCKDHSTNPISTDNFQFSVKVHTADSNSVANLKISVWNRIHYHSEYVAKQKTGKNVMASSTISFQLLENSYVNLALYTLDGKLFEQLKSENMNAGSYNLQYTAGKDYANIRAYKCVLSAKSTSGYLFVDSTYFVLYKPSASNGYIGHTSAAGTFSTTDKTIFPNLFSLPTLIWTNEASSYRLGSFTISDTVDIYLTDTVSGQYMHVVKTISNGPNNLDITWSPVNAQTAPVQELPVKDIQSKEINNPTGAVLSGFSVMTSTSSFRLTWNTSSEVNVARYAVLQAPVGTFLYTEIASIMAAGNSSSEKMYSLDCALPSTNSYLKLKIIDRDSTHVYSDSVTVYVKSSSTWSLSPCYPNPFN
jgi:hypothetical protein